MAGGLGKYFNRLGHSHLQGTKITVAGVHWVVYEAAAATVGESAREG